MGLEQNDTKNHSVAHRLPFSSVDVHKLAKLAWQALFLVAKTTALGQTDLLRGKSIRVHDRVIGAREAHG